MSLLNEFKKVYLSLACYRQHHCFLFYNDFCKLLIITKDSLIQESSSHIKFNLYNRIRQLFWECLSRTVFIGLKSCLKKHGKLITRLEYQRKPKSKKNQQKSEAHNSARYPAKLSNILGYFIGVFVGKQIVCPNMKNYLGG